MMGRPAAKGPPRKRTLEQVTAWLNPRLHIKDRLKRIRQLDQRQSESRIAEDALLYYLPMLEQRLQVFEEAGK